MELNLSLVTQPPEALVTLHGELDLATAPLVGRRLQEAIDQGCRRMVVDLAAVTFIDASALGMLALTRRTLHEQGGSLRFVAYRPTFLRLCRATGLAEHFGLPGSESIPTPA